jgi:hypothetical protein
MKKLTVVVGTIVLAGLASPGTTLAKPETKKPHNDFDMVVSAGAAGGAHSPLMWSWIGVA